MSRTFGRNGRTYEYHETGPDKGDDGQPLNRTYIASLPSHEVHQKQKLAAVYARRYRNLRILERHEEQQTTETTLRTDSVQLEVEESNDGIGTQATEPEYLRVPQEEPHEPANFAPTPEERTFQVDLQEEEQQQQLLEEINTLAENITIRTPESHTLEEQEEDNEQDPNDSSDPSDSESEDA